jgi:MFS transporter, AAHS family, vanillate permease
MRGNSPVNTDPRQTVANSSMSMLQILAVIITIGLNALDGFDVLSISFASPGISTEWHLTKTALGYVLSMELIGMALGSLTLGGVADRFGRRPLILGCLVAMTIGMFMATQASNITELSVYRVLTGYGIGGLLAAINAVAAEFSNTKSRDFNVSMMSIGYPIGAVAGGIIVKQLLVGHDWHSVFYFGAAFTAIFIPLVLLWVPESVHWLVRKQPAGALEKVNKVLTRMGQQTVNALPTIPAEVRQLSFSDIFSPALAMTTVLVAVTYFFHVTTFYFVLKWVPKIVVDMGFAASSAAGVLVWANVGGALGGAALGFLTLRFGVKGLTIGAMILSTIGVIFFGRSPPDLDRLSWICAIAGFFTNGSIVGMYAIFAKVFPTHVRASGTGVAIGIGRGGSVLAPIIAGYLFDAGMPVPTVALIMACGSLCAAGILSMVKVKPDEVEQDQAPATGSSLSGARPA